jgi:hypothetical protein
MRSFDAESDVMPAWSSLSEHPAGISALLSDPRSDLRGPGRKHSLCKSRQSSGAHPRRRRGKELSAIPSIVSIGLGSDRPQMDVVGRMAQLNGRAAYATAALDVSTEHCQANGPPLSRRP